MKKSPTKTAVQAINPRSVKITEYTKRDLRALLIDDRFWTQPRLPITKRRVISHVANAKAEEIDVVLITAYDNDQLVGYLGILPDILAIQGQAPVKFGWLTTWWADKESEYRLSATQILFSAIKRYANRIAVSSFSDDAKCVYDATRRFRECVRFDREYFLIALPPWFHGLSGPTRSFAAMKNRMICGRKLEKRGLEIQVTESLNGDLSSFINAHMVGDPLGRDASYWRWILQFPWVSGDSEDEAIQKRYEFSVFIKDFRQLPMVVSRHGAIIAFLFLTLRNGRLGLKYAYYDSNDASDVATALRVAVADIKPWLYISADSALNAAIRRDFPFYIARKIKPMLAYATKALPLSVGCPPQFGIGDNIFT
jgi:hypothetical protein